jgi:hypothetical protein
MKYYIRVKWDRNILGKTKWSKAFVIGHLFCRKCLLKHFIKRNIKGRI